jgi:hypothetical protein
MRPRLTQYLHGALNYCDHCSSIGISFTRSAQPQIYHGFLRTPYQGSNSYELLSYCVEAGCRDPFGILLASNATKSLVVVKSATGSIVATVSSVLDSEMSSP